MLRSIAGVIAGYAVMFLFFLATFTAAYLLLGIERIFRSDSYEVSAVWLALSAAITLSGSILGGYVCAAISKNRHTCEMFAALILITLIVFCIPKIRDPRFHVRAGEVSYLDSMRLMQMPVWMHLLNPILGAAGVLLLARRLPARKNP